MLSKLIYHERKATQTQFFMMCAAILGLTCFTKVLGMVTDALRVQDGFLSSLLDLVSAAFVLSLFACHIAIMMLTVQRFYKNLLGDEGYLMFTLPVSSAQHINAKWIVGTLETILITLVSVLGVLFMVDFDGWREFGEIMSQAFAETNGKLGIIIALVIVVLIIGIINFYLKAYASMAIGAQWPQNRFLGSVIAYFVISAVLSVVSLIAMSLFYRPIEIMVRNAFYSSSVNDMLTLLIWLLVGSIVLEIIQNTIFYFATKYFLNKKLNLA